jgi:hypothetical protein
MTNGEVEIFIVEIGAWIRGRSTGKNLWRIPNDFFYLALDSNFKGISRNDSLESLKSNLLRNGYTIKEGPFRKVNLSSNLLYINDKYYEYIGYVWERDNPKESIF